MIIKLLKNGKVRIGAMICVLTVLISLVSSLPSASADGLNEGQPVISGGYLRGIKEQIKCSKLKSLYTESAHGCSYNLFDLKGNYISIANVGHTVSTGDYIKDANNKVYVIVVTGDVDGNGKIDITDTGAIKLHFSKKITLKDESFEAADTNDDGRITATDYLKIKYHIQAKYNIHDDESFDPDKIESSETSYEYDESGWTSGWA